MDGECLRRNNSQCQRRCIKIGDTYAHLHQKKNPRLTKEQIKERRRKRKKGKVE